MGRLWQPQERAWTVFDTVTITYRGAKYEIGRGRDFYGIWMTGAPRTQPLDRWPETPEGWSAAWTRFASIEAPGTISPVGRRVGPVLSGRAASFTAAALLGVGVVLGVAGLFPAYLGGSGLAQQPDQVIPHAIYLAVWTASAVLILLGGARLRFGALLSLGLSAVTFGLFFADARHGHRRDEECPAARDWCSPSSAGLPALRDPWSRSWSARPAPRPDSRSLGTAGSLARPRGSALGPLVLLVLAGLGAAAAFAPAWDTFTLRTAAGSRSRSRRVTPLQPGTGDRRGRGRDDRGRGGGHRGRALAAGPAGRGAARRGYHPDGGPGHLGSGAGPRDSVGRSVRDLARAGLATRAHDKFRFHPCLLDLLRVPRRAHRVLRVDVLHAATGRRPGPAARR